jgi:uncharacterized membrane protein
MKKFELKKEIFSILLIFITIVLSFYFYSVFPDQVATHWNFAGEVDNYSSKFSAAFIMPLVLVGMYVLFTVLPKIDPKKERYEEFAKVYAIFKTLIIFFMAALYVLVGLANIGYGIPIGIVVPLGVGLLFVILGNYLSKVKSNWFVGIKTPWTLSNEEVWNKTHRFGGKAFMLAGVLIATEAFMPLAWRLPVFVAAISIIVLGTVVYSYVLFKKEGGKNKDNKNK